jgi:hypothetical protein
VGDGDACSPAQAGAQAQAYAVPGETGTYRQLSVMDEQQLPAAPVRLLSREQMLDALEFLRKLEAELLRFVVGQPIRHLRKDDLMVAVRSPIPRRLIEGRLGELEQCPELSPHFFRVDFRRIGACILQPQA